MSISLYYEKGELKRGMQILNPFIPLGGYLVANRKQMCHDEETMTFEHRLREAQQKLRPFCRRLTKDPLLADEMLQHASVQFWRFWQHKPQAEVIALMTTACRRFYYNHREKEENQKRVLVCLFRTTSLATSLTSGKDEDLLDCVRQGLQRLPFRWREVLIRVFSKGQTNKEVAESMHERESTIKNWRRRALERLARIVEIASQS
jgi:RNA polymerase sigma factor (sigma-70 family)